MKKATTKKKRAPAAAKKKKATNKIKKTALKKLLGGAVNQPMGWIMGTMPDGFDRTVSRSFFSGSRCSGGGFSGSGSNRARSGQGTSN